MGKEGLSLTVSGIDFKGELPFVVFNMNFVNKTSLFVFLTDSMNAVTDGPSSRIRLMSSCDIALMSKYFSRISASSWKCSMRAMQSSLAGQNVHQSPGTCSRSFS